MSLVVDNDSTSGVAYRHPTQECKSIQFPQKEIKDMRNVLLAIDVQFDFCDPNGALYVAGANEDSERTAEFLQNNQEHFQEVYCTLDQHHLVDIAHPSWFIDENGASPTPFTVVSVDDMVNGVWRARNYRYQDRTLQYLRTLQSSGRYPHVIWPEHCLIGSRGACVQHDFMVALNSWAKSQNSTVSFVAKGSNPFTEHFSAIQAEVPDPNDSTTQVNSWLVSSIEKATTVYVVGQALSHCVANTVRDLANNFRDQSLVSRICLLTDCSSPVTGFEDKAKEFLAEMTQRGMRTAKSTEISF